MTKHNQQPVAITEEALVKIGFFWNEEYKCHYLQIGKFDINVYWDRVVLDTIGGAIVIPNCRTMQDLKTLIRLLGGGEE